MGKLSDPFGACSQGTQLETERQAVTQTHLTYSSLSSRERVRLALEHRETDRIPIAMVCSGINEPARTEFAALSP